MLLRLLPLVLLWLHGLAWAGTAQVLVRTPLIADGQDVFVPVQVPGLSANDKIKLRPLDGELVGYQLVGQDLLLLQLRPPEVYKPDTLRVELQVRGGMKLDEDLLIPLAPRPRATVELSFEPPSWTIGSTGTVKVTLTPKGSHPIPEAARAYAVRASAGKLGPLSANGDGTFTATWTPPAKLDSPAPALFAVTDMTAPDRVHGLGALPMLVKKGADATGVVRGTIEPPVLLAAPLGAVVPAGASLRVFVAVVQADGTPWAGAPPELPGLGAGRSEGGGWFSFEAVAPATGSLALAPALGAAKDSLSLPVTPAWPTAELTLDPPALAPGQTAFTASVSLRDAAGNPLPKQKLGTRADGATIDGTPRDNANGTYTARFKTTAEQATVMLWVGPKPSTNPVARLVVLPMRTTLPADGKTQASVLVLPVDAYGLPVVGVKVELTTPLGDGNVPPTVTSDAQGFAWISLRAGAKTGPVILSASANGVAAEALFWQHGIGANPGPLPPIGDAQSLAAQGAVRAKLGVGNVAAGGVAFGAPALVTLSAEPGYTTPGASIEVTVKVVDGQGRGVPAPAPKLKASVGTVGAPVADGSGSFTFRVSLPPGVDGPLQLDAGAGTASGTAQINTLESMGGVTALEAAPKSTGEPVASNTGTRERESRPSSANEASVFVLRFAPFDMAYLYDASSSGEHNVPLGASFSKLPPLGVFGATVHMEVWPGRGKVGLDAKTRLGAYQVAFGSGDQATRHMDLVMPTMVGARARLGAAGSPVAFTLGAWGQMTDTLVFEYASPSHAAANPTDRLVFGARLGAGLQVDTERLDVRIEGAEAFGPRPMLTSGSLLFDLSMGEAAMLTFGADYDLQSLQLRSGEGEEEDTVSVRAHQAALMFGVGVAL